jgi:hypothetical protein
MQVVSLFLIQLLSEREGHYQNYSSCVPSLFLSKKMALNILFTNVCSGATSFLISYHGRHGRTPWIRIRQPSHEASDLEHWQETKKRLTAPSLGSVIIRSGVQV